jgi:hypothetical protein
MHLGLKTDPLCPILDLAGREGPSSPNTPRPYIQALCIPLIVISSLIHLQRRHRTKWRESHLLMKEGTIEGVSLAARNLTATERIFYMPQSWDMGQII